MCNLNSLKEVNNALLASYTDYNGYISNQHKLNRNQPVNNLKNDNVNSY